MENSFKSIIDKSKSILILLPTKPYFDQVASGLGLYLSLHDKKDIGIYTPSPMTVEFNRLIGVNKISEELGNKNLVIRFTDYRATDIERVSYDIENSQFKLTVIPKQKISPPTKDQIELSYSGVSVDTVIIIGGANESHFPALSGKDLLGANIVHIGIRDISLATGKNYISFSRPASSISEITADLIKESGGNLDQDVATNLLMGIDESTNNFTDATVTADTFLIISELMKAGGKRLGVQMPAQRTDFPEGAIPGNLPKSFFDRRQNIGPNPTPFNRRYEDRNKMKNYQNSSQKTQHPQSAVQENKLDEKLEGEDKNPPNDWLKPKIFKGTSVS
jgi:hypothetical protein